MSKSTFFYIFILSIFSITINPVLAQNSDKENFNNAYTAYKEAVSAGDYQTEVEQAKISYELGSKLYGGSYKSVAALAYNYGSALVKVNDDDKARTVLKETLELYKKAYGENTPELIDPLMELGHAYVRKGDSVFETRYYDEALKIVKANEGEDSNLYAQLALEAGENILTSPSSENSKHYLDVAYKIFTNNLGSEHARTGSAAFLLGKYEMSRKKYRKAVIYLLQSLSTFENADEPSSQAELLAHALLVVNYELLEEPEKSTEHLLAIGRMNPVNSQDEFEPIFRQDPPYPGEAFRSGKDGYVIVKFTVDEDGKVKEPEVVELEGHKSFEKAALDTVSKFRYAPRFIDGEPVATKGIKDRIDFLLPIIQ